MANELFKLLPKVDELFKRQDISHAIEKCGKEPVKEALNDALSKVRELVEIQRWIRVSALIVYAPYHRSPHGPHPAAVHPL